MIPAWDYSQVRRDLKRAFEYRYEKNGFGGVRMVGLLFAPPEARLAREEIIPGLRYFHYCVALHDQTAQRFEFTGCGRTPFKHRSYDKFEKHAVIDALRCNDFLSAALR